MNIQKFTSSLIKGAQKKFKANVTKEDILNCVEHEKTEGNLKFIDDDGLIFFFNRNKFHSMIKNSK